MTISSPYGVPYDPKAAGMRPTYLSNIPMTATRQLHPDVNDEAMPYRPRERSMEKAFRQLCCGSCWGFCAWIAGIMVLLTGVIVVAVVLVSNSKHSAAVAVQVSSRTSPVQLPSTTTTISSPVTSFITITASSQQPSISILISTISPLQPSTVTDIASQTSTSTVTITQTSTTTSTVSPPQTQTVTQSLPGSLTTLTTTSVSTASRDSSSSSSSRLTSLIQTINAPPEARLPLSPPCFVRYLNDIAPGLYTGQSWTTVGTYEFFSTAGGVPIRDALMTYTGVELGATTIVWPLCGEYTLSTYSVAPTVVPPTTFPTITRTSVIVVTRPTSTVPPLQQQHTLLPTPSHANLAISPPQPANTIPSASGGHSKPATTSSTSDRALPIPSILPLKSKNTTQTEKPTYTTAPDWQTSTSKRTVTTPSIPTKRPPRQTANRSLAQAHPQQQHDRVNNRSKRKMNPGVIVAIVLGSLIVVIAAIGLATRWFRHGCL